MFKFMERFKRAVVVSLMVMMAVTVFFITIDLGWILVTDLLTPPTFLLGVSEVLETFGFFLLVLIGMELLETIRSYLTDQVIHLEVVFTVAMIAMARKVVVLDLDGKPPLTLVGIAAIILALAAAFYLFKRAQRAHASLPGHDRGGTPGD